MIQFGRTLRGVLLVCVALAFAACAVKPEVNIGGPFHIASVEAVGVGTAVQLEDLRIRAMQAASRVPPTNNPMMLRIHITNYHEKDPGLALLIGDANKLEVFAEVIQPASGTVVSQFRSVTTDDAAINGVIGAVMAATANENKTMARMDTKAANDIMEHIYGSKVWRSLMGGS
jgi:hypothetical protein